MSSLKNKFDKKNFVIKNKKKDISSTSESSSSDETSSDDEVKIKMTKKRKKKQGKNKKAKRAKRAKKRHVKKDKKKLKNKPKNKLNKRSGNKKLESLKSAIENVKKTNNIKRSATKFNTPRSTLNNHFNGKAKGFVRGRPRAFSNEEEESLVTLAIKLGARGFGLNKDSFISIASEFAKSIGKSNKFTNGIPGNDWVILKKQCFLKI